MLCWFSYNPSILSHNNNIRTHGILLLQSTVRSIELGTPGLTTAGHGTGP